jgi:hypothetical protein
VRALHSPDEEGHGGLLFGGVGPPLAKHIPDVLLSFEIRVTDVDKLPAQFLVLGAFSQFDCVFSAVLVPTVTVSGRVVDWRDVTQLEDHPSAPDVRGTTLHRLARSIHSSCEVWR